MTARDQRELKDRVVSFRNLSPEDFPFTIEWWLGSTKEIVFGITLLRPSDISQPALTKLYGEPVGVTVTHPNGIKVVQQPHYDPDRPSRRHMTDDPHIDLTPRAVIIRRVADALLVAAPWSGTITKFQNLHDDVRKERVLAMATAAVDAMAGVESAVVLAESYRSHRMAWASSKMTPDLNDEERDRIDGHYARVCLTSADALMIAVLEG